MNPPYEVRKHQALAELDRPVSLTYTGTPGCACGCRGRYSERKGIKLATIAKIKHALEQADDKDDWGLTVVPGCLVAIDNGPRSERTRTYTAYTDGRTS